MKWSDRGQGWDKVTFRQRTTMHTKQWKKLVQGQPWFSLNLKIHIQLNVTQIGPRFVIKLYRRARFLETKSEQKSFNEHWHHWRPLNIEFEYIHTVWVIPNPQCRASVMSMFIEGLFLVYGKVLQPLSIYHRRFYTKSCKVESTAEFRYYYDVRITYT